MTREKVEIHRQPVWIMASVELSNEAVEQQPVGLFVSARGSTRAYVNDVHVGSNGIPAMLASAEIPGTLDSVFYVPPQLLRPGPNSVLIFASAHRPHIIPSQALHRIKIATYRQPPLMLMPRYLPALFAFGAFLVGAIYFGAMALTHRNDRASLALGAASLLIAAQLVVEALRGLWAYPYPFHGIRLAILLALMFAVGLALAAHTAERLKIRRSDRLLAIITLAAAGGALLLPKFEAKMDWVALVPSVGSAGLALLGLRDGRRAAGQYAAAFLALTILVLLDPVMFFDVHGFWAFAALLLFLFIREARELRKAERERQDAEARRRQLESALDRLSTSSAPISLVVGSAGCQHRIPVAQIAALSGAGDYVELRLLDGREVLHNGSLTALEKALPAMFLRVHRSHIVNLEQIVDLHRFPTGTGELHLRNGAVVPVSRRVMPQVKRAMVDPEAAAVAAKAGTAI